MYIIKADISGFNYYLRRTADSWKEFSYEGLKENATKFTVESLAKACIGILNCPYPLSIELYNN